MSDNQRKSLYECRGLTFSYAEATNGERVLNGIDLSVSQGELVCLTGPSGSGKSTLLNLFGLIEPPQAGELLFDGRSLKGLLEEELNHLRRYRIGFVFQDFQLIDVLSVEENVEFFLTRQKVSPRERAEIVATCLQEVGLWEHRKKRPGQLSGGQKQRVAIARALAKRPQVVIADEPTASLDHKTGRQIMERLDHINKQLGVTIILASHDPMVLEFGVREIRLQDGVIVKESRERSHVG